MSGAESKAALWPGMSSETLAVPWPPSRPPTPGTVEIEAGEPPGGLTMFCSGPVSVTVVTSVPLRPG